MFTLLVGSEGGGGVKGVGVFAFKMVPLLTETGSPDGAGMESRDNDRRPDRKTGHQVCWCVSLNGRADIWTVGNHTDPK